MGGSGTLNPFPDIGTLRRPRMRQAAIQVETAMHDRPHSEESKQKISVAYTSERKQRQSERMKLLWATASWKNRMSKRVGRKRIYPKDCARALAVKTYQQAHIAQGLCIACANPICDFFGNVHRSFRNRFCEKCYRKRCVRRALKIVHGLNYIQELKKQRIVAEEVAVDLLTGLIRER